MPNRFRIIPLSVICLTYDGSREERTYEESASPFPIQRVEDVEKNPELKAYFEDIWQDISIQQYTHNVVGTNDVTSVPAFHLGSAALTEGRLITQEEYEKGAKVCLVSEEMVKNQKWKIGDKLKMKLFESEYIPGYDRNLYDQPIYDAEETPFVEEGEYEIVGIYSRYPTVGNTELASNTLEILPYNIYIPTKSISKEREPEELLIHTLYEEGKAIWDAKAEPKDGSEKLCLTTGEVSEGILYTNALGVHSRITVTDAVYEQLKQEGYQIYLRLPDGIEEQGTADNVVGYLPGKDHTKAVVLGANFDGAGQCGPLLMPGAYNNASGVATLLQTARWLAASDELPCDVVFAAFNTEDNREKGSSALSEYIEKQYTQIRMVNLKCLGWKEQPLTVYGADSEADLRKSLAGGLGVQYADMDVGGDEAAFREENMSSVVLIQDACLNKQEVSAVLNSVHDVPENLDFAMLDETAKKLAAWVIERGDEPLVSYVVYW